MLTAEAVQIHKAKPGRRLSLPCLLLKKCAVYGILFLFPDRKDDTMHLQESGQMYLETILVLSKTGKPVRSVDVSEYMGFSKPSVSRAIGLLKSGGYVAVDEEGHLTLTEEGRTVAENIYEKHTLLTQFLVHLGVDEKTAAEDACKMEHVISDESFAAIKKHAGYSL